MKIPPYYTVTSEMLALLTEIEASRMYFSSLTLPLPLKEKIQRVSLLKSSLFSARIEGNTLTLDDLIDKEKPFLPPRQEEIYNIIKDHVVVSFDRIRRRFLKVPPRTLRYDLKKLVDRGLVEKAGETKGSYYRIKKG